MTVLGNTPLKSTCTYGVFNRKIHSCSNSVQSWI